MAIAHRPVAFPVAPFTPGSITAPFRAPIAQPIPVSGRFTFGSGTVAPKANPVQVTQRLSPGNAPKAIGIPSHAVRGLFR